MEYKEVSFKVTPFDKGKEVLIAYLSTIGYDGFLEENYTVKAYISKLEFSEDQINEIQNIIPDQIKFKFICDDVEKVNWNEEWEKNFKPVMVTPQLMVRAPFHKPASSSSVQEIIIQPKMSFGTAHHPTTSLVLQEVLEMEVEVEGAKVFDFGCGTGVLGILACMKGAASVLAVDNDEWACENAIENAQKNSVNMFVDKGGFEKALNQSYNIILANITKNVLVDHMVGFQSVLLPLGHLLMSGFHVDDENAVRKVAKKNGFSFVNKKEKDGWCMLHMIKKSLTA